MPHSSPLTTSKSPLQWSLGGRTFWQFARRVTRRIFTDGVLDRSAELAFDFLLAIFPLMLFILTLLGLFASYDARLHGILLSHLARFLPVSAFRLLKLIAHELSEHSSGGKLAFGILVGLWLATSGVASMISGLNLACRIRESRSWLKVRAIALALTISISFLVLFVLGVVLLGGRFAHWAGALLRLEPLVVVIWVWLEWPLAVFFVATSFSLIYRYGPDLKNRRWGWLSPGSLAGALIWLVVSIGFRFYLRFFNAYSFTYGSLGAVIILLIWLYASSLAFLIGGEINAEIESSTLDRQRRQVAV
jgi:membrane protein